MFNAFIKQSFFVLKMNVKTGFNFQHTLFWKYIKVVYKKIIEIEYMHEKL